MKSPLLPDVRGQRTPLRTRAARLTRLAVHLVAMRLSLARRDRRRDTAAMARRARQSAARMLDILEVRPVVTGRPPAPDEAVLVVANHISWLDIQAIGATTGARFVAKTEIARWPIVGAIAARCGTIFLRRGSCRAAWRVKNTVADALRDGDAVAVFPEGTTTDGRRVEPFRAALLQAAVDARARVYPVSVRYQSINRTGNRSAAFVGDMSFLVSLWRIVREPRLAVQLHFGPSLSTRNRTRRELAAVAQLAIVEALTKSSDAPLLAALAPERATPGSRTFRPLSPPAQAPAAA